MSYGPKNDDGDNPRQEDEAAEDTVPDSHAHLHAELEKPTPAQIETALQVEAASTRRAAQIALVVKVIDAFDALVDMGQEGLDGPEWKLVGAAATPARALYKQLFDRDLKARSV